RFHWCSGLCRREYGDAIWLWGALIDRLTSLVRQHGTYGVVSREAAWSAGDPKDRARVAIVDGEEKLFVREGEGWLVFHIGQDFHGRPCFVGPPERADSAPACEARAAHIEDLRASHSLTT
ncbi:MAG: hypothetical protein ACTHK7_10430, partial [Aureliella sp.]